MKGTFTVLVFLLAQICAIQPSSGINRYATPIHEDPEVHMNASELITSKGYPCENYDVHTTDGFIIQIQRIPAGRNMERSASQRPVVLLLHGLVSCSACWVENLVNESLGFLLADAGFDVWLSNSRGNTYGMRHERYTPKQKEFWAFSWDEMGLLDLPATVDKVLSVTNATQLSLVGYSQGATAGFAGLTANATLAKKINVFLALAPALYLADMTSPMKYLAPFANDLTYLFEVLGHGEFLPNSKFMTWLSSVVCGKKVPPVLCENFLFVVAGYDANQMNASRLPVYSGQNPAGTSVQNIIHFAQMVKTGKFAMFDFGEKENMKKYNQSTPPEYFPNLISNMPIAIYSGTSDWLVGPKGVSKLVSQLNNILVNSAIPDWEHLDFIWAMDAPSQCYNDVISILKKYNF